MPCLGWIEIKKRAKDYSVFIVTGGLIAFVSILIVVSLSFSSTSPLTGAAVTNLDSVESIETCTNETWTEEVKLYDTCYETTHPVSCTAPPANVSCTTIEVQTPYECVVGTQNVLKSKQNCKINGYVVNDAVTLNTEDYSCSLSDINSVVTVLCDSVFDGNGDGVCGSGESCTRFVIDGTSTVRTEKNSRDEWVASDESYFLNKASVVT